MALEDTGSAPASQRTTQESIRDAVKELQSLKVAVVAGAAADTNIALAGADTNDLIVSVLRFTTGDVVTESGAPDTTATAVLDVTDLTAEAAITSAGQMQLADTDTTGDKLVVIYFSAVEGA